MAVNLTLDDVRNSGGVWKKLWALKIPPKVKHWFWRTCRDFLRTKARLRYKHIPVDSMCVLCGKDRETSWHLYMQCELVLDCWDLSGFRDTLESMALHVDSLSELFLSILVDLELEAAGRFLIVGWRIWKMRNEVVWEDKRSTAYRIVSDTSVFYQEWLLARQPGGLVPRNSGTCSLNFATGLRNSGTGLKTAATRLKTAVTGLKTAATGLKTAVTGLKTTVKGSMAAGSGPEVAGTGVGGSGP
ncbi:hypothetical protein ACS0TY_032283 [Phlomoides rotata]